MSQRQSGPRPQNSQQGETHLGPVNDLVGDDNVTGADLLAETADGREGDDRLDSEVLQGGNVGAGGDARRRDRVVQAMAGEERERDFAVGRLERRDRDRGRRGAPGRDGVDGTLDLEVVELVQAAAANHAFFGHVSCDESQLPNAFEGRS